MGRSIRSGDSFADDLQPVSSLRCCRSRRRRDSAPRPPTGRSSAGRAGKASSTEKGLPTTWSGTREHRLEDRAARRGHLQPDRRRRQDLSHLLQRLQRARPARRRQEDLKRHVVCLTARAASCCGRRKCRRSCPSRNASATTTATPPARRPATARTVYVFFGKSGVFAFDLTGKQLWQADVGDGLQRLGLGGVARPVREPGDRQRQRRKRVVVALDKATGKEVWRARGINEAWNTPLLLPDAGGKTELVVAIPGKCWARPGDGQQLWSCDTDIRGTWCRASWPKSGVVYCIGGRPSSAVAVKPAAAAT